MKPKKRGPLIFAGRKGNAVLDLITVLVVLFIFVITIFGGKLMLNYVNDDIQADASIQNDTKEVMAAQNTRYTDYMDGAVIFLFVLLWGLVLVASFNIDSHPVFFIFTVILLIFVFIAAAYIGNAYEEISAEEDFASITTSIPMTDWLMTHLLLVAIVVGFSIVLVLYGKSRSV